MYSRRSPRAGRGTTPSKATPFAVPDDTEDEDDDPAPLFVPGVGALRVDDPDAEDLAGLGDDLDLGSLGSDDDAPATPPRAALSRSESLPPRHAASVPAAVASPHSSRGEEGHGSEHHSARRTMTVTSSRRLSRVALDGSRTGHRRGSMASVALLTMTEASALYRELLLERRRVEEQLREVVARAEELAVVHRCDVVVDTRDHAALEFAAKGPPLPPHREVVTGRLVQVATPAPPAAEASPEPPQPPPPPTTHDVALQADLRPRSPARQHPAPPEWDAEPSLDTTPAPAAAPAPAPQPAPVALAATPARSVMSGYADADATPAPPAETPPHGPGAAQLHTVLDEFIEEAAAQAQPKRAAGKGAYQARQPEPELVLEPAPAPMNASSEEGQDHHHPQEGVWDDEGTASTGSSSQWVAVPPRHDEARVLGHAEAPVDRSVSVGSVPGHVGHVFTFQALRPQALRPQARPAVDITHILARRPPPQDTSPWSSAGHRHPAARPPSRVVPVAPDAFITVEAPPRGAAPLRRELPAQPQRLLFTPYAAPPAPSPGRSDRTPPRAARTIFV